VAVCKSFGVDMRTPKFLFPLAFYLWIQLQNFSLQASLAHFLPMAKFLVLGMCYLVLPMYMSVSSSHLIIWRFTTDRSYTFAFQQDLQSLNVVVW
jgi:hypothetical protein